MFGNNPFKEYRATQQQVQEAVKYPHMMYDPKTGKEVEAKTPADHNKFAKMGYTHEKPKMDEKKKGFHSDANRKAAFAKMNDDVNESKFVIPEEIPANEKNAFMGAAAAAAKAGKKSFNFGGKTHSVTMKKDTAKAITSDTQKEALDDKDKSTLMKVAKKLKGASAAHAGQSKAIMKDIKDEKRRKMKKDEKSDVNMNPKMDNEKADKGSAMETKESTIREKLIAVLEGDRAKHYKGATKPEGMHDKTSPGGKEMMNQPTQTDDTVKKSHDDASKAGKTGKDAKARGGGDMVRSGDQKIVPGGTPMKGMKGTMEAYTSMYETVNYHNKMAAAHDEHATRHEREATNSDDEEHSGDHDMTGVSHDDAAQAHKAASMAHKEHGGDSEKYKAAAKKAKDATGEAKKNSSMAPKFKHVSPPQSKI